MFIGYDEPILFTDLDHHSCYNSEATSFSLVERQYELEVRNLEK
jgi:hypothetical protein